MSDTLQTGSYVKLGGLNTQILNGAEGRVLGRPDEATARYPIRLLRPEEAVAAYPDGVKVKAMNLELMAQPAIDLTEEHAGEGGHGSGAEAGPRSRQSQRAAAREGARAPNRSQGGGTKQQTGIMAGACWPGVHAWACRCTATAMGSHKDFQVHSSLHGLAGFSLSNPSTLPALHDASPVPTRPARRWWLQLQHTCLAVWWTNGGRRVRRLLGADATALPCSTQGAIDTFLSPNLPARVHTACAWQRRQPNGARGLGTRPRPQEASRMVCGLLPHARG